MDPTEPTHRLSVDPDLSGYENLVGTCSNCKTEIIVNRATDLSWAYPAAGKTVNCLHCSEPLRIGGDSANHPIDQFQYDAARSFYERRYMQCVVTLSQSIELALWMCARTWILGPVVDLKTTSSTEFEELHAQLSRAMDRFTLEQLRRVLVSLALLPRPSSVDEARERITSVGKMYQKMPEEPELEAITNTDLRNLAQALRATSFVKIRNAVVHEAYRPTQEEAEACRHDVRTLNKRALNVYGLTPGGGQLIVAPSAG